MSLIEYCFRKQIEQKGNNFEWEKRRF